VFSPFQHFPARGLELVAAILYACATDRSATFKTVTEVVREKDLRDLMAFWWAAVIPARRFSGTTQINLTGVGDPQLMAGLVSLGANFPKTARRYRKVSIHFLSSCSPVIVTCCMHHIQPSNSGPLVRTAKGVATPPGSSYGYGGT